MGWLIAFGIVALLALTPLGVSVRYGQEGWRGWVRVGPARICVYPFKKTEKKREKTVSEKKASGFSGKLPTEEQGGSWKDFLPLVSVLTDFLKELRRKIRVRYLQLHITMAGEDPCDLAVNYGRLNIAMAGLLTQLNRFFVIRRQSVWLRCDFAAEETVVAAELDVSIMAARAAVLLVRHGIRAFKTFLTIKKQRESGANL